MGAVLVGLTTEMLTSGIGEGAGIGKSTIGYLTGGVAAIGIALKSFTIIPEGSVGVKTRFGKARRHKKGDLAGQPVIKGAGAHATFPGVHNYKVVNVRHRSSDLEPSNVEVYDEQGNAEKRSLQASVTWRVSDEGDAPYRALFEVEDGSLTQMVTNICLGGLRKTVEEHGPHVMNRTEDLYSGTYRHTHEWLGRIGVTLEAVQIKDSAPSEAQILANALGNILPDDPSAAPGSVRASGIAAVHLATPEENIA